MKKILFIGASGVVAEKVISELSKQYDIVGVSKSNKKLRNYCTDYYTINLLQEYRTFFSMLFQKHIFDIIIWNPVAYFLLPLDKITRAMFHTEFDVGVVLALECFKSAYANGFSGNKVFIIISSLMAYGVRENRGTYSIVKQAQIRLAESLSCEYDRNDIAFKVIAYDSIPSINEATMIKSFVQSIENTNPEKITLKVDRNTSLL
jgi:NAD(P)-dependent dehydrogenase (short-subunit alcohol dehydrogenase family)